MSNRGNVSQKEAKGQEILPCVPDRPIPDHVRVTSQSADQYKSRREEMADTASENEDAPDSMLEAQAAPWLSV